MQIELKDLIQKEEKLVNMASEDVATSVLCLLAKAKRRELRRVQLPFSYLQKKDRISLALQAGLNTLKWNIYMSFRIMIVDVNTHGHSIWQTDS